MNFVGAVGWLVRCSSSCNGRVCSRGEGRAIEQRWLVGVPALVTGVLRECSRGGGGIEPR